MAQIHCPKCDAEISSLSLACPACGTSLNGTGSPKNVTKCPKCDAEISPLSVACPACGTSLADSQGKARYASSSRPAGSFFDYFWGILTAPQTTFEGILAGPRGQYIWPMLFLAAFFDSLSDVANKGEIWYFFLFPLIAVAAYLGFWIAAWLISVSGRWLGGLGSIDEIYDYLIWAEVPGLFSRLVDFIRNLNDSGLWRFGWGAVEVILAIWAFIISLLLLAQAQRFSAWMAFLNLILSSLIVLVPLFLLLLLFRLF